MEITSKRCLCKTECKKMQIKRKSMLIETICNLFADIIESSITLIIIFVMVKCESSAENSLPVDCLFATF